MHVGLGHGPSRFYSTTSTGRIHYCELDFENRSVKPRTDFTHGIRMPKNTVFLGLYFRSLPNVARWNSRCSLLDCSKCWLKQVHISNQQGTPNDFQSI